EPAHELDRLDGRVVVASLALVEPVESGVALASRCLGAVEETGCAAGVAVGLSTWRTHERTENARGLPVVGVVRLDLAAGQRSALLVQHRRRLGVEGDVGGPAARRVGLVGALVPANLMERGHTL